MVMSFNELNSVEYYIVSKLSGVNLNAADPSTSVVKEDATPYGSFRTKQNITIAQFNTLASAVARKNKVPVIDLHACVTQLVKTFGESKVYTDGVHFTEAMKKKQAEFMATRIRDIAGEKK